MSRREIRIKGIELEEKRRNLLHVAEFVSDMDAYVIPALYLDEVRDLQQEHDGLIEKVLDKERGEMSEVGWQRENVKKQIESFLADKKS